MTQTPIRRSRSAARRSATATSLSRTRTTVRVGATGTGSTRTRAARSGAGRTGTTYDGAGTRTRSRTAVMPASGAQSAADRAYERRRRRSSRITGDRLESSGQVIGGSLKKVPFIVLIIAILATGAGAVLWINTKASQTGVQIQTLDNQAGQLQLQNETLQRQVAQLDSTPNIAKRAQQLGLVPTPGDSVIVDCTVSPCRIIQPTAPGANG